MDAGNTMRAALRQQRFWTRIPFLLSDVIRDARIASLRAARGELK